MSDDEDNAHARFNELAKAADEAGKALADFCEAQHRDHGRDEMTQRLRIRMERQHRQIGVFLQYCSAADLAANDTLAGRSLN